MSTVTHAVLSYIKPRLDRAERIVADAQRAASPPQGYKGFELALKVLQECKRAIAFESTHDATVSLQLLEAARAALGAINEGDAAPFALQASALIGQAAVILRPAE